MRTNEQKFTIGRSGERDIILADDSGSRLHAELLYSETGQMLLTDCHSFNGTQLIRNGKEKSIHQELLSKDDIVMFGDIKMTVKELIDAVPEKVNPPDADLIDIPYPNPSL